MKPNKKQTIKILLLVAIFIMSISVWLAPVVFKGYTPEIVGSAYLVRAKNLSTTGIYGSENNLNTIVSSELLAQEGHQSLTGRKTSGYLYALAMKYLPLGSNMSILIFNAIVLAIVLLIFSLTVWHLFGYKIAIYFSLIYIFLPFNWEMGTATGYIFPMLFMSGFFLSLIKGLNRQNKYKKISLLALSGILLALTSMASEVFILLTVILLIFLWLTKKKFEICYIFIPLIIILGIFWLPTFISGQNTYLLHLSNDSNIKLQSSDLDRFAHVFPDAYTYHFNYQPYLDQRIENLNTSDLAGRLAEQKALTNFSFISTNIRDRVVVGTNILIKHLSRFLSLREFGGPIILFIGLIGLSVFYRKQKYWLGFSMLWIFGSIFLMSYIILVGRNHLSDFNWLIATAIALGAVQISSKISTKNKRLVEIVLMIVLIYHFTLIGHLVWAKQYDNDRASKLNSYIQLVEQQNINDNEIIAFGDRINTAYNINYNTNNSIAVFDPITINQLINEGKLKETFEEFEVDHILGYSPEISKQINEITGVSIIADDTILTKTESAKTNNKNWLLNIIR